MLLQLPSTKKNVASGSSEQSRRDLEGSKACFSGDLLAVERHGTTPRHRDRPVEGTGEEKWVSEARGRTVLWGPAVGPGCRVTSLRALSAFDNSDDGKRSHV